MPKPRWQLGEDDGALDVALQREGVQRQGAEQLARALRPERDAELAVARRRGLLCLLRRTPALPPHLVGAIAEVARRDDGLLRKHQHDEDGREDAQHGSVLERRQRAKSAEDKADERHAREHHPPDAHLIVPWPDAEHHKRCCDVGQQDEVADARSKRVDNDKCVNGISEPRAERHADDIAVRADRDGRATSPHRAHEHRDARRSKWCNDASTQQRSTERTGAHDSKGIC
mmetsp:Transcript_1619/g.5219  ORF Transcript_1619/g.5219 Transcript_1619/m.5219 type:complete len:230 (+) Transcript_1619:853-1542(+)